MTSVKDLALVKAEQGETEAWLALKSVPDEAARQALALIAKQAPEIAMRTLALIAGAGVGKDGAKTGLEFRGALYIADREARTGERFGLHFYWDPKMGPIDSVIGIRDRVSKNIGPVDYHFRPLTAEESELNDLQLTGIKPDIAVAVEITVQRDRVAAVNAYNADIQAYKQALTAIKLRADVLGETVVVADLPPMPTIQYTPVTGIGIVLGEEMYDDVWNTKTVQGKYGPYQQKVSKKPREEWGGAKPFDFVNYTYAEKAETRSLRAGFRRIPGALAEYEQALPVGEGVTFDLPEAKPVPRVQLLEAIEQEQARLVQKKQFEGLPEAEKAAVVATMRAGAYGAEPPSTPPSAPAGEVLPAIDTQAVLARLRAEVLAAEEAKGGRNAPNAVQQAKVWQALDVLRTPPGPLTALVQAIVGTDDFATVGGAKAVWQWLDPKAVGDTLTLDIDAVQEAHALLAELIGVAEELQFSDAPEGDDDASTLDG